MSIFLHNCRIWDEEGFIEGSGLLIEDGKIRSHQKGKSQLPTNVILYDLHGYTLLPGLIDIHTHGVGDFDTKDASVEGIIKMRELQAADGTTAFLPTLYPAPIKEMRRTMGVIREAGTEGHGAEILGVHLEGPFINPVMRGALGAAYLLPPSVETAKRLIEGFEDLVKLITVSPELEGPELEGIDKLICWCVENGITVSMGHSNATFDEAGMAFKSGAKGATHLFNRMRGFHHREPGISGFSLTEDEMYTEIIADLKHLHPAVIRLVLNIKSRRRILLVSDSVRGAKKKEYGAGPVFLPDGTIAGSAQLLFDGVRNLCDIGVKLEDAVTYASYNPASYSGVSERKGSLKSGYDADILVVDGALNLKGILIRGKWINGRENE
ncbi:MAG: N-acetylglucosamine-6-phosphate deacetylase [Nitrospirae bacterium]|nr:N-acetylglucosamine-6-phosphate deacetylase [Nitrospirota bacterium]